MSSVETPHFDIPFRLSGSSIAVVEQDSIDDVADCVVVIVSTPIGWRDEAPTFGIPDQAMIRQPLDAAELARDIGSQEPRALLIVDERVDQTDELIALVNIGVSTVRPQTQ
jgi:phage baseplate assembly protein W